jgi:type IV secretion system protein VirB10
MNENQQPPPKVDPESLALRAPPRPVVRLNRRMLAVVCGLLAAMVLGATIWSLQPQRRDRNPATELYNVDRVARPENLEQLPKDYSGLPARSPAPVPLLGEPLPGDLGPAIVKAERDAVARASAAHTDAANAERLAQLRDAEEAAKSTIFFRKGGGSPSGRPESDHASKSQRRTRRRSRPLHSRRPHGRWIPRPYRTVRTRRRRFLPRQTPLREIQRACSLPRRDTK